MNTHYRPEENPQQSSSGRVRQAARKLNFQVEDIKESTSTKQSPKPFMWRSLNASVDFSDQKLPATKYFFPQPSSKANPSPVSSGYQLPGQGTRSDHEDLHTTKEYRSLAESDSFIQGLDCESSDDVTDLACRASAGATDVVSSTTDSAVNNELSQNLQSLTDVMVNLNLTKYLENISVSNAEADVSPVKFRQSSSKSETVTSCYTGPRIKFRSPSNYDQNGENSHVSKNSNATERSRMSFLPSDLAPISHMLRTCEVFHPLDMEPKEPHPTPVHSPVRSLMDGGDAVDVRGLANRLSHMKSESSMKNALRQYMNTHLPSMHGQMDQIIESTVQQIAEVSLRDKKVPSSKYISGITATPDWLQIQNGGRELSYRGNVSNLACSDFKGTSGSVATVSDDSMNSSTDGIVELDVNHIKHHENVEYTAQSGSNVAEVYCPRGNLIHSEYISPEEYRFASYTDRKGKRKIHEVDGDPDPSPERPRRKGKKKVAFAFVDDEYTAPEVIRFKNGSWN